MRRSTALAVGGFRGAESLGSYDDVVFATKLYLTKRVFILNECLTKYRRHGESSSRQARDRGESVAGTSVPLRWGFLEWLECYLAEQDITDPRVWSALREEFPMQRDLRRARLLHARTLVEARVRRCLAVLLPKRAYFGLMRWRRDRDLRRAALRLAWARAEMARGGPQI